MSLLSALAGEGKTVVIVTHEREFSRFFTRTLTLRDGVLTSDTAAFAEQA
jgi:putative ABC transport system ATP-binding protein